jgi:hypothetical protein
VVERLDAYEDSLLLSILEQESDQATVSVEDFLQALKH